MKDEQLARTMREIIDMASRTMFKARECTDEATKLAKAFAASQMEQAVTSLDAALTEEQLKQEFRNQSNCYVDADDVLMAMDEAAAITFAKSVALIYVNKALLTFKASSSGLFEALETAKFVIESIASEIDNRNNGVNIETTSAKAKDHAEVIQIKIEAFKKGEKTT